MPVVIALLSALVPVLVELAEKQFAQPKMGDQKDSWVTGLVHELLGVVSAKVTIPDWAAQMEPGIEKLLCDTIEAAVAKIDPPAPGAAAPAAPAAP